MEYVNLGRKLGVGTRIAAKILRERAQHGSTPAPAASPRPAQPVQPITAAKSVGPRRLDPQALDPRRPDPRRPDPRARARNVSRGLARGGQEFGRGFWKPFAHAGRALWHEVTGVFFAIFALFFAQNLWRVRGAWRFGPEHRHFQVYVIFLLVFGYFSIAAFVSSRRSSH